MTESGRGDDAFEHDEDLLNDDEFVLDLGDEDEAEDDAWQAPEGTAVDGDFAVAGDPLAAGADDAEFFDEATDHEFDAAVEQSGSEPEVSDELLDLSAPDSFVLVDSSPVESAPGQAEVDADDLLFSDERDGISVDSEFGADLGPTFGSENSFEMGDNAFHAAVGTEAPDSSVAGAFGTGGDETFEVDLGADDDDAGVPDLDAEWDAAASDEVAFDDVFAGTDELLDTAASGAGHEAAPAMAAADGYDASDWETEDGPAPEFDAAGASGPQGDLWEDIPLGEAAPQDDYDPIYGEEGAGLEAGVGELAGDPYAHPADAEGAWSEEADYSEYEEAYADGTVPSTVGQVVGSIQPRRSLRWVAGLAALIPFVAAGVIAFTKPEWVEKILGNGPNQNTIAMVDRTEVERPVVRIERVEPPKVTFTAAAGVGELPANPTGGGEVRVDTPPDIQPVEVVTTNEDPLVVDPSLVDPGTATDPITANDPPDDPQNDPGGTEVIGPSIPDVAIDTGPDAVPDSSTDDAQSSSDGSEGTDEAANASADFYAAGDDLLIARIPAIVDVGTVHPVAAGLRPGGQAFARLDNGSQFSGSIRRIEASTITLALGAGGEVTFRFDEVLDLMPLANANFDDFASGRHRRGYVRLKNNARIFGSLHRDDGDGTVTLVEPNSVVAVPDWQILRFGYEASAGVEIVQDENDDDWLRKRVRRKIDER